MEINDTSLDTQTNANANTNSVAETSATGTIDVSVVIPARNEEANIRRCLEAVLGQETLFRVEIIVIDSGSEDATVEIVRSFPQVQLIEIPAREFGHGRTRNLGAEEARGTYVVFLNADALPMDPVWLNHLIDPMNRHADIAGVFSRHFPREDCYLYMARDLYTSMPDRQMLRTRAGALDFMLFSTVSGAVRKEIWRRFPFQPDIIIAEDQDWARKILDQGYNILYQPTSAVRHSHNYTSRQLKQNKQAIGRASGRFNNRFSALTLGLVLAVGGMVVKMAGDAVYIWFRSHRKISISRKIKETGISLAARAASFYGRYLGWAAPGSSRSST